MQLQFRENIECLREEIVKREKSLGEKKEKLFNSKDPSQWDLQTPITQPEQIQQILKDKARATSLMLPKDTQAIVDLKDLFIFVTSSFKKEAAKLSDLSLAEIGEHLNSNAAEQLIHSHHRQGTVWNDLVNMMSQQFPNGVLTKNETFE